MTTSMTPLLVTASKIRRGKSAPIGTASTSVNTPGLPKRLRPPIVQPALPGHSPAEPPLAPCDVQVDGVRKAAPDAEDLVQAGLLRAFRQGSE